MILAGEPLADTGSLETLFALPCSRCGCRVVSKLGRGKGMLICADCGHPQANMVDPARRRNTALAAFSLIGILMVGTSVLMLDSIHDSLRQGEPSAESSAAERSEAE